jgi:cytochrome c oxidase subunit 2
MKYLAFTIVLTVLLSGCISNTNQTNQANANVIAASPKQPASDPAVKTFVLTGQNFKFVMDGVENPDLLVKQGDRVRIEFSSTQGMHNWVVDEFNATTAVVNPGESTSVEFTADKKGTFEYYCSVMQHRKMGMRGNLTVE